MKMGVVPLWLFSTTTFVSGILPALLTEPL